MFIIITVAVPDQLSNNLECFMSNRLVIGLFFGTDFI